MRERNREKEVEIERGVREVERKTDKYNGMRERSIEKVESIRKIL